MKLTNEICISFLQASGWLLNHDKEITISEHNKAIDDFVQKVKKHQYVLSDVINSKDYGMFTIGIEQIAEELKKGEIKMMTKEIKMTKEEALRKLIELEDYIKKLDEEKIGYKEDKLFLLSIEEYEKYKDIIPECKTIWWLSSPGSYDKFAAYVDGSGWVDVFGNFVDTANLGIRPALKIETYGYDIGETIVYKYHPYIVIDKDLCIAKVPIDFDKFDEESNDYESSYIRTKLKEFTEEKE